VIDLYSDTVTKPSPGMLRAMCEADVGDDQRGDDPTARAFEERVASLLGQPAAMIVPTATMANQIAVIAQCRPGDAVLCHPTAHILNFEAGGLGANAGVQAITLDGPRGIFGADTLCASVASADDHTPRARLVVVENTSNFGGGTVWPRDVFDAVVSACKQLGLKLHVDGARLFNAAVADGSALTAWSNQADSVQLCFSKGLGCPFGAVLAASTQTIAECRRIRQRMGGALRQTGVLAAAMNYALDHNVERLAEDHARLKRLADGLAACDELELGAHGTNILFFRHRSVAASVFVQRLKERGVWVSALGETLRICTHLQITDADVASALGIIERVCAEVRA
jgi:threonine aldolase